MLDNTFTRQTPEGGELQLTTAGVGVRTMAFTVDLFIRFGILLIAAMVLGFAGKMGTGLFFILWFAIEWFYPVIFETYKGATPGKKAYGLVVVYDNGLPVTFSGALIRNLFRAIDILPFAYLTGATSILLSKQCKRLGDLLAGTLVVYKQQQTSLSLPSAASEMIIDVPLTYEQQKAIISFAERCEHLSEQRQEEMAAYMLPILGCSREQAVPKLKSIAATLVGKA